MHRTVWYASATKSHAVPHQRSGSYEGESVSGAMKRLHTSSIYSVSLGSSFHSSTHHKAPLSVHQQTTSGCGWWGRYSKHSTHLVTHASPRTPHLPHPHQCPPFQTPSFLFPSFLFPSFLSLSFLSPSPLFRWSPSALSSQEPQMPRLPPL